MTTQDEAVAQGDFYWRMAGSPDGKRQEFIDAEVNSALAGLADLDEANGNLKLLHDEIDEARTAIGEVPEKHEIGDDLDSRLESIADTKADHGSFPSAVAGLVREMAKAIESKAKDVAKLTGEIERLKTGESEEEGEEKPKPKADKTKIKLVRPGLRKARPRRGESTMSLFPEEKIEIKEVVKKGEAA